MRYIRPTNKQTKTGYRSPGVIFKNGVDQQKKFFKESSRKIWNKCLNTPTTSTFSNDDKNNENDNRNVRIKDEHKQRLNLQELAVQRNEKIKKYKELKEMEEELIRLKSLLDKDGDDEICRNFYLTYIRKIVNVSLDELNLINQEKPLAKHLAEVRARGTSFSVQENKDKYPVKPFKPIIITRNELQKKVFGAGYPSLPTMTVDEFYRERVAEGM